LIVGIIGVVYFGYEALQATEHYEMLGVEVTVTGANWTPVIVSGAVALIGLVMTVAKRGR